MRKFHYFLMMLFIQLITFNVFAQTTSPLVEGLGNPLITEASQISSNASDEVEGKDLGVLIDNNSGTYWHSDWHGKVSEPHYLQFEVNDPLSDDYLVFYLQRRNVGGNSHLVCAEVLGSEDGENWDHLVTIDIPKPDASAEVLTEPIPLPKDKSYLHFRLVNTPQPGGPIFFHAAEIELYHVSEAFLVFKELIENNNALRAEVAEALAVAKDPIKTALITSADQMSSPYSQNDCGGARDGGDLSGGVLLDGNKDTYWHSAWSGNPPAGEHYILISDIEDMVGDCQLYICRRNTGVYHPIEIKLLGADNPEAADEEWEEMAVLPLGNAAAGQEYTTPTFHIDTPHKYVRIIPTKFTIESKIYWATSELQIFTVRENPDSQFATLGEVATTLESTLNANLAVEDDDMTIDIYNQLLNAYDAFLAALDDLKYFAAMDAIEDGGTYRISTEVDGTMYYVTANGFLTSAKEDGAVLTLNKTAGGALYDYGIKIEGANGHFSNTTLVNDKANLNFGSFRLDTNNNRNDWECQVFYLDEGKFAIRSCNTAYGESSWADAGRAFWTYEIADVVTPCYTYDTEYIWNLENVVSVNVTYQLVETDGTVVSEIVKKQEAGSEVSIPASLVSNIAYSYSYEAGTIGNEECTIIVTRTPKNVVTALEDLSNAKTYKIACDRGALLTKDGYLASTAHSSLTNAEATEFAVISYEGSYYLYSVADQMFVTNSGELAEAPIHGVYDAIQMARVDGWGDQYFMWTFKIDETTTYGLNTNGNDPYGYVINSWLTADPGNMYYMVEEADFDAADALDALVVNPPSVEVEIGESGYATIYLPYAVTTSTDVDGQPSVAVFTGKVTNGYLAMTELTEGGIPANTPVIIKGLPGVYEFAVGGDFAPIEDNDLIGTDEAIQADGTQYILAQPEGKAVGFYQAEQGTVIPAGKAYLIGSNGVKGYTLNGETAIEQVQDVQEVQKDQIYDLSGRRVEKAIKGIYIINGKKIVK